MKGKIKRNNHAARRFDVTHGGQRDPVKAAVNEYFKTCRDDPEYAKVIDTIIEKAKP